MSKTTDNSSNLLGLLGIVFIVLKLTEVIDWSWWWVLAPFWGPAALAIIILIISLIFSFLTVGFLELYDYFKKGRQKRKKDKNVSKVLEIKNKENE